MNATTYDALRPELPLGHRAVRVFNSALSLGKCGKESVIGL